MRNRLFLAAIPLLFASCAGQMLPQNNSPAALAHALIALSPRVRPAEAQRAADCAYTTSARLAREYRVVGPAVFQNGLVNTGLRKKGLCFHYTEDLLIALRPLHLKTLEIHWALSHPGSFLESNALVLTARGQPLEEGIVLDPWRHAGRLYWNSVAADRAFPWHEDHTEYARSRLAEASKETATHRVPPPSGATSR